jgi:hypothetical protein
LNQSSMILAFAPALLPPHRRIRPFMTLSDPSTQTSATSASLEELRQSYRSLSRFLQIVAFLLLVVTGSVSLFLRREVIVARRQVSDLKQFVADYEKNSLPPMLEFRNKLFEFSNSHADFKPIFMRYFSPTNSAGALNPTPSFPGSAESSPVRMPNVPAQPK